MAVSCLGIKACFIALSLLGELPVFLCHVECKPFSAETPQDTVQVCQYVKNKHTDICFALWHYFYICQSQDWRWQLKCCQNYPCEVKGPFMIAPLQVHCCLPGVCWLDDEIVLVDKKTPSRACHEDTQLTRRRRVKWGEWSKVTGIKDKGWNGSRTDLYIKLTWKNCVL